MPSPLKREQPRGVIGQTWDLGSGAVRWFGREALMPALEKLIPQGASELANALFQGNGYMPYGTTQRPVPKPKGDEHGVHGPEPTLEEKAAETGETR